MRKLNAANFDVVTVDSKKLERRFMSLSIPECRAEVRPAMARDTRSSGALYDILPVRSLLAPYRTGRCSCANDQSMHGVNGD
jgi:hypothetical protein